MDGKSVCIVTCQRSLDTMFLKWKGIEQGIEGDFYVRRGPGSVRLSSESARQHIQTRFPSFRSSTGESLPEASVDSE